MAAARAAMAKMKTNKGKKIKSAAKPLRRAMRRRASAAPATEAALAAFAHDIRTALTGILALGELLSSSNLGERERRWAFGIKGSAEHLAALTTLVIDAAKAESGGVTSAVMAKPPESSLASRRLGALPVICAAPRCRSPPSRLV